MKLQSIQSQTNFKSATININALSDTHGHTERADMCYQTMMRHNLLKKEQKGVANYLIVGGDWFIAGSKKGYLSDPKKPLGLFQLDMYNKFVSEIKNRYSKTISLFAIGNHDFDGGVELFHDIAKDMDSQIISSNLDFENSPALSDLAAKNKIVQSRIDFIEDSWQKKKYHPVLNLAIAPVNMSFYNEHKGVSFIEDKESHTPSFHTINTFRHIRKQIDDFRKQYPHGLVILTSHTGVNLADDLANFGGIDLIFDAHEHKDEIRFVNKTPIVALSMDFQKLTNAKIKLDDEGYIEEIKIRSYNPPKEENLKQGKISAFYQKLFRKDIEKTYTIKPSDKTMQELSTEGIREKNNNLANFITDSILDEIQKIDPDVQVFALNASSFRGGFELKGEPNVSRLDVMECLDGIREDQAGIFITEVTGEELAFLVKDNLLFNRINPQRRPLIQYSGLKYNKTKILENSKSPLCDLCRYIVLSDTNQPIDPKKTYKIANPEKYFIKTKTKEIKDMYEKSIPLGKNVIELLIKHFEDNSILDFGSDIRIEEQ